MKKIKQKKVLTSVAILSLVFLLLAGLFVPVYAQESSINSESIIQEDSSIASASKESEISSDSSTSDGSTSEEQEKSSKSQTSATSESSIISSSSQEPSSESSSVIPQNRFAMLLDGIMPYAEDLVNSKTLTGIHFKLSNGYEDTAHWRKAIYGLNAYCVEPGVNALGTSYTETEVFSEQYYRMSLADYWGREWLGDTPETNFYVQLYVWETLGNTLLELSGPTVSYADYQAWCGKINAKIDAFFTPPSFANQSVRLKVGESITLTDTNNALSAYYVSKNYANLSIAKNDYTNTVTLTAKADSKDGKLDFKYDVDPVYEMPMYYWNTNDGQDVVTTGVKDPSKFSLNITVDKTGTLALKKTSEDGKVGGLEFNVKSVDGSFNQNLITAEDGTFSKEVEMGDYVVSEIDTPDRYLPLQSQTVTVKPNETTTVTFNNVLKRGDIKGIKVSDGDMKRLANIPFKITASTTGESHVVVTDENGVFDTSASWNSHKTNTNRGETSEDGIWFGDIALVDDGVGALFYDTYTVEELPCEANANYTLFPAVTVRVYRNNVTVDLGTLTNDYIVPPQIGTQAKDNESGGNDAYVNKETSIVDTVEYSALTVGKTYTVKGRLMDKATNSPLLVDGKEITAETTFVADKTDGTADVTFTFDSLALKGKEVVVFETLYLDNKEVVVHADIEDKGQTIKFFEPKLQTTAKDKVTGTNEAEINKQTTIIDTVSYSNLIAGKSYTVKGVLMDKATNSPLLVDGKEVTASTTFVADKTDGTVDVSFTFDSSALAGKEIVVFESLYYSYREIATHADINDVGQTIKFKTPPTPPSEVVKTGDDTNLILPLVLLVIGVSALCFFLWKNKQYKQSVALQEETADSETDEL